MTDVPRLSHAEEARTLIHRNTRGALSTLSAKHDGHPFASAVTYATIPSNGSPLLLISTLATHATNLAADPRATLLVTHDAPTADPLASGRVSLMGTFAPDPDPSLREILLEQLPEAAVYIQFADFSVHRMTVSHVRFIGGFGRMSWLSAAAYTEAAPDPLYESADDIIAHMNEDHADALILYCQAFGELPDADAATLVSVDRYGYDIEAWVGDTRHPLRLPFSEPATTPGKVRAQLVQQVQTARNQLGISS